MDQKLYGCYDLISPDDMDALGIKGKFNITFNYTEDGKVVKAVKTDIYRAPKADEWYLSNHIGQPAATWAFRAFRDMNAKYYIMKLVLVERKLRQPTD